MREVQAQLEEKAQRQLNLQSERFKITAERDIRAPLLKQIEFYRAEKDKLQAELSNKFEAELIEKMRGFKVIGDKYERQLALSEEALRACSARAEGL